MCVLSFMYKQAFPNEKPVTFHEWVANQFGERLFIDLLQDLHREGVGHELRRHLGRLGRPAHQGPCAVDGDVACVAQLAAAGQEGPGHQGQRRGHQDADRYLPVSAQGSRHDVGRRRRQGARARWRQDPHGHPVDRLRWDKNEALWTISAKIEEGESKTFTARHVISSAPIRELLSGMSPAPECTTAADELRYRDFITVALIVEKTGPVRRQLDLHPRARREGRSHPELPVLVARDGAQSEPVVLSASSISASRATGCGTPRTAS